ncbi:hypothetical protein [Salinibacter ruber]|uniref:hypothetical protein n=1 Tax=Salinibacter ruber TaxID=146919 RepID=UPI00216758BA|nr:hypothetical protein [Salinibacter ruber]MCS4119604.1 hypothetical protein [Salinibacter ruber]
MAIDELEVLLNLDLGPLEDKVDDAIDEVDRLDGKSTDNLEDDFEDTAEAADDLTESMEDADSQSVRPDVDSSEITQLERRLSALDGRSVEIDADVDRERLRGALGGGGGGRTGGIFGGNRLPGELDEVQEGFMALGAVPPQLKALGAAGATAAAALGAGAGLAGVATKLAAELGPQGLQSDVQGARATFKETGREFASAFSGVIRSEVLPAVRGLAATIQTVDDELATFSGITIDLLKNIQGAGPLIGAVVGAGRAAGQSQSNADALAQGVGNVPGIREITRTMTQAIQRVRERFQRDLIPREEMLEQVKGLRLDAVKQLQKLEQQVPGAFPPNLLDAFVAKLKQVRKQLKEIRTVSLDELPAPGSASKAEPAAPATGDTGSISGSIPNAERRIALLKRQTKGLSRLGKVGTRAFRRIGSNVGRTLGQILTLQKGVGSLGQAFQSVGASIVQAIQGMIQQLTQAVAVAGALRAAIAFLPGVNAIGGASSFGGLLGGVLGLANGGVVQGEMLAKVGEGTESEAVMPLSRLSGMVEKAAAMGASVPAAVSGRSIGVQQAGSATTRIEGGNLSIDVPVEAVNTANRIGASNKRRTGRKV